MPKSPGPKKKEKEKDKKKEDEKQKSTEKVKKPNPVESGEHSPSDSENEEPNSPPPQGKPTNPTGVIPPSQRTTWNTSSKKIVKWLPKKWENWKQKWQFNAPPPSART